MLRAGCGVGWVLAGGPALPEGKAGRGGRGVPGGDLRRCPAVAGGSGGRPGAGRRGGLACRPGPQASTLHSGRHVKSARPGAGAALAPGPEPRAGTGRCPPGQQGAAIGEGRPLGGYREGGTVARIAKVRATVVPAPATGGQPGSGVPACGHRVMVTEGSVMAWLVPPAAAFPFTKEIGF